METGRKKTDHRTFDVFLLPGQANNDDPQLSLFEPSDGGVNLDVFEFIAGVFTHIPEPRTRNIHYFGVYLSRSRALRKNRGLDLEPAGVNRGDSKPDEPDLTSKKRWVLTRDVTDRGLRAGDVGSVVERHSVRGAAEEGYSVEVFEMTGRTDVVSLPASVLGPPTPADRHAVRCAQRLLRSGPA